MPGVVPVSDLVARFDAFEVPKDLSGKRVLDIGAATGWCSFEAERRGAEVLAIDCVPFQELMRVRELLGSKIRYEILDIEEVTPARIGTFDIVFFFGVLYHVRHPLLALENVCSVTRDMAYVESFVTDFGEGEAALSNRPALAFYETDELGGQIDNWFGPNLSCLAALCRSAGFASVVFSQILGGRGGFRCRRRQEFAAEGPEAPPRVSSAVNNRSNDIYFSACKDEYINLYFDLSAEVLRASELIVEIDGFGCPVLKVSSIGQNAWQASLRRPGGLARGPHAVRVRSVRTEFSQAIRIWVGEQE